MSWSSHWWEISTLNQWVWWECCESKFQCTCSFIKMCCFAGRPSFRSPAWDWTNRSWGAEECELKLTGSLLLLTRERFQCAYKCICRKRHVVHVDACTDQYLHLHVHVFMHTHLHTYTYSQHYLHVHICPALGRNQTLLCCAFRLHYHIQSAVT